MLMQSKTKINFIFDHVVPTTNFILVYFIIVFVMGIKLAKIVANKLLKQANKIRIIQSKNNVFFLANSFVKTYTCTLENTYICPKEIHTKGNLKCLPLFSPKKNLILNIELKKGVQGEKLCFFKPKKESNVSTKVFSRGFAR
ncbi:hypothetical protein RFI_09411 [Reticulomyxa filosa]|uniref:Uncharacterized protein n=1 Tax=Reticulomyxa filosa TaxID=46433 RepID=X6NPT3_RETFI|nr:hypothetical protein RFI_09411 [Reticulomyxa filosa]|eukprot:ETO27719.1 hypothetical protein RFI_09411 [Reticulomyxa filosa]